MVGKGFGGVGGTDIASSRGATTSGSGGGVGAAMVSVGHLLGARVNSPASCSKGVDRWTGETKGSSSISGIDTGWPDAMAVLSLKSSLGLGLASGIGSRRAIGRPEYVGAGLSSIICLTTIGPLSPSSGKGPL